MRRFFRIPFYLAFFIALGLIFGFITFKILSFSRTVEVPSISNMTVVEANDVLSKAGLYLKIEGEDFHQTILPGHIIRQDVPPGKKVKEKRVIKAVISKGPRIYSVPSLVNEMLEEAESMLIKKGLMPVKIINVHSDTVEKGRVIAQKPEPDEPFGDQITLLVSLGPHELSYYCPDFYNKNIEDVKEITEKLGLNVETKGTGNIVKTQKPKPGTVIKTGEKIFLEMREETANGHDSPIYTVR